MSLSRLFARQGYSIALIARSRGDSLTKLANEIKETGGDVKKYLISFVPRRLTGIHA